MEEKWYDVLVEIDNPALLDQEVQRYGSVVIQNDQKYKQVESCYVVRTMSPRVIQAVIEKERGKVIRTLDELL